MANSMTGYGRVQETINNMDIIIEIKSVNHRYFDFSVRAPRIFGFLDEKLKSLVQSKVSRGKIDMYCSILLLEGQKIEIRLNEPMLESYLASLNSISEKYHVPNDITVSTLARNQDIFNVLKDDSDTEEIWTNVLPVATKAIDAFVKMRADEGERLCTDLFSRLGVIENYLPDISKASEKSVDDYRERMETLLAELLLKNNIDQGRIVTEVAIMADKVSIVEEIVRLKSHIIELKKMLRSSQPQGRKMDFLLQEMNREINTIGSKSVAIEIAKTVVEIKAELEKIREQVQNFE